MTNATQSGHDVVRLERTATTVDLFRFSAVTWNAHRIHYDEIYAREEGLPGVVVQAHLVGAWLYDLLLDAAGPGAKVTRFGWRNTSLSVPGTPLTLQAQIKNSTDGAVTYDLVATDPGGTVCARGEATVNEPGGRP